jgi:hypothetical protein
MTRTEAINRVLAALGAGGTVLCHGPDPQAVFARQLVDCAAALEMIRLDPEPSPMNWDRKG